MIAASAFSGAGCADEGLRRAGFEHLWFCEKVPVRRSVLRRHYPGLPICEDVKNLASEIDSGKYAAPDLFWFSPPCQDLSIAGLKKGLDGERSGLFFDGINALRALRDRGTRYAIMEQVPGLLNSDSFEDFLRVLAEFAALRPVSWGYRILDAQYFGVAQVRRRLFFVLDFGGERAREILFEQDGGERRVTTLRDARESITEDSEGIIRSSCRDKSVTLSSSKGAGRRKSDDDNLVSMVFPENDYGGSPTWSMSNDKAGTVDKHRPDCVLTFDYKQAGCSSNSMVVKSDKTGTMRAGREIAGLELNQKARTCLAKDNDSHDATLHTYLSTYDPRQITSPAHRRTMEHGRPCGTVNGGAMGLVHGNRVRRLTPVETERLFGLPSDYTRWRDDGTEIKDSPRYEMLGDGVVSNVSEWLGRGVLG